MRTACTLDPVLVTRMAFEASVDPRTLKRFLAGQRVKPLVRSRILIVLAFHGVKPPVDKTDAESVSDE